MSTWQGFGNHKYEVNGQAVDIRDLAKRFKASGLADGMVLSPVAIARGGNSRHHAGLLDKMQEVGFIK